MYKKTFYFFNGTQKDIRRYYVHIIRFFVWIIYTIDNPKQMLHDKSQWYASGRNVYLMRVIATWCMGVSPSSLGRPAPFGLWWLFPQMMIYYGIWLPHGPFEIDLLYSYYNYIESDKKIFSCYWEVNEKDKLHVYLSVKHSWVWMCICM